VTTAAGRVNSPVIDQIIGKPANFYQRSRIDHRFGRQSLVPHCINAKRIELPGFEQAFTRNNMIEAKGRFLCNYKFSLIGTFEY
jgi:hypothetical protein